MRRYIRKNRRAQADADDLERINSAANELNSEVADVLQYQAQDDLAPTISDE
jgi:hypothetical protein